MNIKIYWHPGAEEKYYHFYNSKYSLEWLYEKIKYDLKDWDIENVVQFQEECYIEEIEIIDIYI